MLRYYPSGFYGIPGKRVRINNAVQGESGRMAYVFTMLIEGKQNPSEADLILRLAKSRDFFGECMETFYGRDSVTDEPVQHSFLITSVGWVPKSMNQLRIEGCYRITDDSPSVLIEKYDFSSKTGTMTYRLPKSNPGEMVNDVGSGKGFAAA